MTEVVLTLHDKWDGSPLNMLVLDIQNHPARRDQGAKREAGKQIGFPFFPLPPYTIV